MFEFLKMFDFQHIYRNGVLVLFEFYSNILDKPFLSYFVCSDRTLKNSAILPFRTIFNYFACAPEIYDLFLYKNHQLEPDSCNNCETKKKHLLLSFHITYVTDMFFTCYIFILHYVTKKKLFLKTKKI